MPEIDIISLTKLYATFIQNGINNKNLLNKFENCIAVRILEIKKVNQK